MFLGATMQYIRYFVTVALCVQASTVLCTPLSIPSNPFSYELGIKVLPSRKGSCNAITICCHGYGGSNTIVDTIYSHNVLDEHLVGFNFPDFTINPSMDHSKAVYGTIYELLPLFHIISYYACDQCIPVINLYGFSAGGAAVINTLAILNSGRYKQELQKIGITNNCMRTIRDAVQRGRIILECPLKSLRELLAFRGPIPALQMIALNYEKNNLDSIDSLSLLTSFPLTIIVYFNNPDETIGNRDDALFIEKIKKVNMGKTVAIIADEGGHNTYHASLWRAVQEKETSSKTAKKWLF
jgi:hypothetical protein